MTARVESLIKLLRPKRFDADPNSPKTAKQLKHWLKVFAKQISVRAVNASLQHKSWRHQMTLTACVSAKVYDQWQLV